MAKVRPATQRVQVADERGFVSREFFSMLVEMIDRIGGAGDVTLTSNLDAGASTDNAVVRFKGTDGDKIQNSKFLVDDNGNATLPSGATVDGRDVSADGAKLDGIEAGAERNDVDSVFGRTGTVTAQAGDYDASQVDNDSGVAGSSVAGALDTLDSGKQAADPDLSTLANDGYLAISDGVTAPTAATGKAFVFVDGADGDLKITFADGTTKTIVTD